MTHFKSKLPSLVLTIQDVRGSRAISPNIVLIVQNGEFKICKNQVSLFKTLSPLQLRKDPKASFLLQTARERLEPQQNLLTDRITQHKQPSSNSQIAKVGRRKRDMDDWYQPDGKGCMLWAKTSASTFT